MIFYFDDNYTMQRVIFSLIFIFSFIFLFNCSPSGHGFAFHITDRQTSNLNVNWYQPRLFKKMRSPIIFAGKKVIWFAYVPKNRKYGNKYAISLSKKSLGWIEILLKNQILKKDVGMLIDFFDDLSDGKYLLRIANSEAVIDSAVFEVQSSENNNVIDYNVSINKTIENFDSENGDDILIFSRE